MLHDVSISSHLVPDVGVGARVVVCTTNGNGDSWMNGHWDDDDRVAEADPPLVDGNFELRAPLYHRPSVASSWLPLMDSRTDARRSGGLVGAPESWSPGGGGGDRRTRRSSGAWVRGEGAPALCPLRAEAVRWKRRPRRRRSSPIIGGRGGLEARTWEMRGRRTWGRGRVTA